jgi:hypothetical protein
MRELQPTPRNAIAYQRRLPPLKGGRANCHLLQFAPPAAAKRWLLTCMGHIRPCVFGHPAETRPERLLFVSFTLCRSDLPGYRALPTQYNLRAVRMNN